MRIQISYDLEATGLWKADLTVVECGDFPTSKIFLGPEDYPTNENYILFPSSCNHIELLFTSKRDAIVWSLRQMRQLQVLLREWRKGKGNETEFVYFRNI